MHMIAHSSSLVILTFSSNRVEGSFASRYTLAVGDGQIDGALVVIDGDA